MNRRRSLPTYPLTLLACILGLQAVPLVTSAQTSPGSPLSISDRNTQFDILFGRNSKGPYPLSWKGVRTTGEIVLRDGITLNRDKDYSFDSENGTLTFTVPLGADQVAKISYLCDTYTATPITSALPVPARQWDVWQEGTNRVSLQARFDRDKNSGNISPVPILAYQGGYKLLPGSDLKTAFYMDMRGGEITDRGGLKLEDQTSLGKAKLGFAYSRAGALFEGDDSTGLRAGQELMEAKGSLLLARDLTLSSVLRQTNQILESGQAGRGTEVNELINTLTARLGTGSLEIGRTIRDTTDSNGTNASLVTDGVKLTQAITRRTQATIGFDNEARKTETTDGSPVAESYGQRAQVGVKSQVSSRLLVSGEFQNSAGTLGVGDTARVRMEASPLSQWRGLKVITNWEDRFRPEGTYRTREALFETPQMALLKSKLSGGVRWSGLPGAERRTTLIDGSLRPLRYMEMKGGARFRDTASGPADSPDRLNTYRLNVALAPWNGLKLTGGYQRNPDSDDGSIRQVDAKSIGLETEVGRLRLRSSYGTEEEYASDRNMNLLELGADWKFSNYTLLSAVYQTRATLSDTLLGSDSYRLTFSHRVGSAFDLSLSGVMNLKSQNRQINWTDAEMRAEAKVGLRF